ncbi:hypothetical protein IJG04_02800 [Candidatus Saccharibacteria bacterium]|nr:hypothetical protein [Candidatus Saccharibacteria bacterium]
MLSPKEYKLTTKIADSLQVENIIYAEFAAPGAMGACGTARVYALDGNVVKLYFIDVMGKGGEDENNLEAYGRIYRLLKDWGDAGKLLYVYGGYGNDAWRGNTVQFQRDDDNTSFIYENADKVWQIQTSCTGVYLQIAPKFTKREMSIAKIEKFFKKHESKMSPKEAMFAQVYIEQSTIKDNGRIFQFTVSEYWDAMRYLEYINFELFNLSNQEIYDGIHAIEKYRLRYMIDRVGWNGLDAKIVEMVQNKRHDVFTGLAELLKKHPTSATLFDDKMEDFFVRIIEVQSNTTETNETKSHNIASVFRYPVKAIFDKQSHHKIIQETLGLSPAELSARAESLEYYLANYLFHEDIWALMDVLPMACHIVERLPFSDINCTNTADLFWLAGEIIDRAWRYLDEAPEKQRKYRDLIYETYWPRIGSVWPIIHYDEFEFKEKSASRMFEDALGFVMSLDDITERNPNIKEYLKSTHIPSEKVDRRAFTDKIKSLSPRERFEKILADLREWEWHTYLRYPENKEEAKIVLDELMLADEDARIKGVVRMEMFEQLLLTPNTMGVGEYILRYLNDNFERWLEVTRIDCDTEDEDLIVVMGSYYSALAGGVTEENEFPPMKLLHKKMLKIGVGAELCDAVAKVARKRRRMILFQRSALEKFF